MVKIKIEDIEAKKGDRPPEYMAEVLASGKVQGPYLIIDFNVYQRLIAKYGDKKQKERMKGAGDLVAKLAQPIAKRLDKIFKTNIAGCGNCKKRQEKLNSIIPIKE